jgi:MFS family permease
VLLCILRFGQGIGLGGEWGGAALLATEYAPPNKRGWFGMFPQLGPSVGFLASNGLFFGLALSLTDEQFRSWGWRVPFLVSAVLVGLGLYVRLKIAETPAFREAIEKKERVRMPIATLFSQYLKPTLLGAIAMIVCYTLFYISTVFSLSYGVSTLHFTREKFLGLLCFAVIFMAIATPLSALASDKFGRRPVLIVGCIAAILSGFTMAPLLGSGDTYAVALFLTIELFLMGVTFAPMGALLPELFPTNVRYTGAGVAYNVGGILGASVAPYIAQLLANRGGLAWVGGYVSVAAAISLIGVLCVPARLCKAHRHALFKLPLSSVTPMGRMGRHRRAFRQPRPLRLLTVAPERRQPDQATNCDGIAAQPRYPLILPERHEPQGGVDDQRHARARNKTHQPLLADVNHARQALRQRLDPPGVYRLSEQPRDHHKTHNAQARQVLLHISGRRLRLQKQLRERKRQEHENCRAGQPASGVRIVEFGGDRLHTRQNAEREHQLPCERIEGPPFRVCRWQPLRER